jgi:hypothetical protein
VSKRSIAVPLSLLALGVCSWAATPFATVSSTEPFQLNGNRVPTAGVPTWPVAAGDVIVTPSGPATLVFHDGSRVEIAKGSKARIERAGTRPVFRLLQGSAKYTLASESNLDLVVLDKPAFAHPHMRGIIYISAAVVGAAAVGTIVAENIDDKANQKPPSASPSR